ncbi:MAG: hypothetical protein H6Q86_5057, partial [candidate division NC10 bacterium]|nr:hypothetical protein [candidate division NC10 bacterium]
GIAQPLTSTVERSAAMNGGSTIHNGPSRLDDCSALISDRSVASLECRRPARSGHTRTPARFPVTRHLSWRALYARSDLRRRMTHPFAQSEDPAEAGPCWRGISYCLRRVTANRYTARRRLSTSSDDAARITINAANAHAPSIGIVAVVNLAPFEMRRLVPTPPTQSRL